MTTQRHLPHACAALMLALALPLPAGAAPGQPMSPSEARVAVAAADLDRDGFVSLDEFHQDVLRTWHALDRDHDGYVVLREMLVVVRNDREVNARLRLADKDGDGKLSFKEVVEARMAFFASADVDKDDRLSLREALDYLNRLQPVERRGR